MALRCVTVVVAQQTAEEASAANMEFIGVAGVDWLRRPRSCFRECSFSEALMWPELVVVANVVAEDVVQMPSAETALVLGLGARMSITLEFVRGEVTSGVSWLARRHGERDDDRPEQQGGAWYRDVV
jgi:hypothetical protein